MITTSTELDPPLRADVLCRHCGEEIEAISTIHALIEINGVK